MASGTIKNSKSSNVMAPSILYTGVTITNYQSYIQNGRFYFSGNVINNSGASVPRYTDILNMHVNTETFGGNALDVTNALDPKPMVCLMQAGGYLRLGNDLQDGHGAWVNVSARLS